MIAWFWIAFMVGAIVMLGGVFSNAMDLHGSVKIIERYKDSPEGTPGAIRLKKAREYAVQERYWLRLSLAGLALSPLTFILAPTAVVIGMLYATFIVIKMAFVRVDE